MLSQHKKQDNGTRKKYRLRSNNELSVLVSEKEGIGFQNQGNNSLCNFILNAFIKKNSDSISTMGKKWFKWKLMVGNSYLAKINPQKWGFLFLLSPLPTTQTFRTFITASSLSRDNSLTRYMLVCMLLVPVLMVVIVLMFWLLSVWDCIMFRFGHR